MKNIKYMFETVTYLFIIFYLLVFIGGCAAPSITSQVLVPAKYGEAAKLRRVAVLPFVYNNRNADNTTADIEATITSVRVDDKPYFSVVERTHLKKIIDEQRLGSTGLIDQNTAVKVGKIAGVEAILMGNITQFGVDRARDYQTESYCSRRNNKGKCVSWNKRRVTCIKRTATFSFVPKLINVSSGRLVVSESFSRQEKSRECDGEQGPSDNELLNSAKANALVDFKNMIAPHYVTQDLALLSTDDSKPPEYIGNKIKGGISFAQAGRMDRACALWEEANTEYQYGYALLYLLGICAEINGDLEGAEQFYRSADGRTMTPVNEINEALARINQKNSDLEKLGKQLTKHHKSVAKQSDTLALVQQKLVEFGYEPGPVDGLMGRKTRDAIRQFQIDNGLGLTGKLDSATKDALGVE